MEHLRRAENPYRFYIPGDLVARLREVQSRQSPWNDLLDAEDVVCLYPGLGPALFLAFDGRIIVDDYFYETGVYEVSDPNEAWAAVVLGATRVLPELLCILPERPAGAADCPDCKGGRFPCANIQQGVRRGCGGLGWLVPGPT